VTVIDRAIILAAGRGSRLGELTDECPKCLLGIDGVPILHRALSSLSLLGVREVVLVVGYLSQVIRASVGSSFAGMRVDYVTNDRHDETSTGYSLWLAKDALREEVLILEADIVFETPVLERIVAAGTRRSVWAGVKVGPGRDEGILLREGPAGYVERVGRIRRGEQRHSEFTHKCGGIQLLDEVLSQAFREGLDHAMKAGRKNELADLILAELLEAHPVALCSLEGLGWAEVDDRDDLLAARQLLGRSPSATARHV